MTRCNLKLGLCLWAVALFAALPVYAQTPKAKTPQILEYSGSNKVVAEDVAQFNKQVKAASPEDAAELQRQREEFLQNRKDKYIEFKALDVQMMGLIAQAEIERTVEQGKEIGSNYVESIKLRMSTAGYLINGDTEAAWEELKKTIKSDVSLVGKTISTIWEKTKDAWKGIGKVWLDAFVSPQFTVNRWADQINTYYSSSDKYYDPLSKLLQQMDKLAKEYKELDDNYNSISKNISAGDLYIYTDPATGAKIHFTYKDGVAQTVKGTTRGCIPLPMKLAEGKSCIFCPLFQTIFNAAQTMATQSYHVLANSIANVLLVGLAIWIAFSVMVKVSSFTKMDTPKFITELLTQIFKVLLAYLILKNADFIYTYGVGPLLKAGMEFGMSLLFEKGNRYLGACSSDIPKIGGGLLPAYLYIQLECFIQAVQAELAIPQSIGSTLMCVSRHAASQDLGAIGLVVDVRLPDFSMMFQGLIIWVFAWLISLAFAFYLIDATVRLGIIGALMPFLVASWPFKVTSKYTSQGWSMFMNTFFTYVFMGLVVSVNIQLMGYSLTGAKGGFKAIEAALNQDMVTELQELLDIGFAGFLVLIASCIFGFKLTAQATELAGSMAGGGSSAIGANIGGLAASAAKAGTLGAGKATWGATKMAGNVTGVTPKLRQARDSAKAWVGKKLGFGGKSSGAASKPTVTSSSSPTTSNPQNPSNPNNPNNGGFSINGSPSQANAVQNAAPRTPTTTPSTTTPTTTTPTTAPDPSKGHNAKLGQDQNSKPQPEQNDQFKAEQARLAGMDAKSLVATGAVNSLYRASNEGKLLKNATDAAQARIGANSKDYADNMKAAAGERNAAAALKNRAAMSGPGDIRDGMLKDAADHEQKAQKFEQDAAKAAKGITDAQKSYDDLQKLNSEARKQFVNNTAIPGSYSPLDYGKVDGNIANILKNNEGL